MGCEHETGRPRFRCFDNTFDAFGNDARKQAADARSFSSFPGAETRHEDYSESAIRYSS